MKKPLQVILAVVVLSGFILASPVYPQEKAITEKPTVYFGFISIYTPHIMYEKFQPLMDYLSSNTPYSFRMRLTRDYNEIVSLLRDGSLKIALLGGASYVIAENKVGITPILKPLNSDGKPFYRSIIVSRKDRDDINSISDLKGKSFAFGARWSTSTTIDPLYYLYNNGISLSDFSKYIYLRYSDSVAREIIKGNYDAGTVIDTMAYFYRDKGLKFIFVSDPLPTLPVVVRKDAPKELIDSVKKALLSLDPQAPLNHEMMKEWGEEIKYGFVEAKDSDYEGIKRMIKYLKGKSVDLGNNED